MNGVTQIRLALQVDDAFVPYTPTVQEAAVRQAGTKVAVPGDRKPVDLPHGRAGGTH